ncbi:MAG: segregation/condensation protein A [Desulfuromonadaceae bacterium]|nr:segregation/condensation protein A [Desulfuromonadaceae bacterium]
MSIEIRLENFSGPLDLLLHLIKTTEMDIYDIQMVAITEQYLAIIEQMKQLDLDAAGEFLLMAATLIHIKSRMLLPASEEVADEEEVDPRAELVRRLLEYQRYKGAAETLEKLPQLDRDVFVGQFFPADILEAETDGEIAVGIYQLADAFHRLLKEIPAEVFHEVVREQYSVVEHISLLLDRLSAAERLAFREIFATRPTRQELVVTFLAMLELVKMRMVKIEQVTEFGEIWLLLVVQDGTTAVADLGEAALGYE